MKIFEINIEDDGLTHINIYSQGNTKLGRQLSNFYSAEFECEDGKFKTIEGYWYWLKSIGNTREMLRNTNGWQSKQLGKKIQSGFILPELEFKEKIISAMERKVEQNIYIAKELKNSELPFKHYYVYNGKIVVPIGINWIINEWERIRNELKEIDEL